MKNQRNRQVSKIICMWYVVNPSSGAPSDGQQDVFRPLGKRPTTLFFRSLSLARSQPLYLSLSLSISLSLSLYVSAYVGPVCNMMVKREKGDAQDFANAPASEPAIYIHTHIHTHTYIYTHTCTYINIHTCIYIYIYIYNILYINTYTREQRVEK